MGCILTWPEYNMVKEIEYNMVKETIQFWKQSDLTWVHQLLPLGESYSIVCLFFAFAISTQQSKQNIMIRTHQPKQNFEIWTHQSKQNIEISTHQSKKNIEISTPRSKQNREISTNWNKLWRSWTTLFSLLLALSWSI